MSIVYKASHVTLGRPVALKILNRHLQSGGSAAERFQREALAISAMDHPNIVKIFGVGNIDDTPYMSMELLEGESLADLLKREQRLTPERAIPIFCQLLDALAHAHERSIIHRDIKPSNVFICADQSVKLLDFGIAKISNDTADSAQKLTATGEIFGTISYMSPEQCTGGKVDHRSDLYSVACLMYEAVDGKPPFTATSAYALATQHTSGHANATEFIAGELGNVILHGLSKNPDDRPQSAAEFKKLLLEPHLLQKKGSKKKPASMTPKQIALGLSLLAVGTMTAYVAWQHSSQKHQPLAQKASSTHSIAKTPIFETLARLARLANNSNATSPDSIKNAIAEIDELVEIRKCTRLQKYSAYFIKHSLQKRLLLQEAEIIASLDECLPFSLTQDGKPTNETGLVQLTKARILLAAGQIERALETTTECEATFAQAHLQSLELPASLKAVKSVSGIREAYLLRANIEEVQKHYVEALKYLDLCIKNSSINPYWRHDVVETKTKVLAKLNQKSAIESLLRREMADAEKLLRFPGASWHDVRYAVKSYGNTGVLAARNGLLSLAQASFEKERDLSTELGDLDELKRDANNRLAKLNSHTQAGNTGPIDLEPNDSTE